MALPDPHITRRRFITASAATVVTTSYGQSVDTEVKLAGLPPVNIFAGNSGAPRSWDQVFTAMDAADVIVIGESHTDASGHAIQIDLIKQAVQRWPGITVSFEEFDRSQQPNLDAFARGEITGAQLQQTRRFVNLQVKANWGEWYLPKLVAARDADAPLLASNAPLKYSRMVRNYGCNDLPELTAAERALFECPSVPMDPAYREAFGKTFRGVVKRNPDTGLKELGDEQLDALFRAHRVWDATMAESVVQAQAAGANKVLHLVGSFHGDFNGGLIQELHARDKNSRILVLSMRARRGSRMSKADEGRADMVIYTKS